MSATATPSLSATMTVTGTAATLTATATPALIDISQAMPAQSFSEGDSCYLLLQTSNLGAPRNADLYVLLDVFGEYWCYPSWQPLDLGLDFEVVTVPAGDSDLTLIPEFTMPTVSPIGPLHFYAALFEPGYLDLEHLASNGAAYEFSLE